AYTITDYDAFSTYGVASDVGTISITDGTITLDIAADEAAESATMTVTRNGGSNAFVLAIGTQTIIAPEILSPLAAATGVSVTPTLTASAFVVYPNAADTHVSTDWQVATDIGFTNVVFTSLADAANLVSIAASGLTIVTQYYARARYNGSTLQSDWSAVVSFTTQDAAISTPSIISPAAGTLDVALSPSLTASAFDVVPVGYNAHASTDWQVATDSNFTAIVFESLADATNLTSIAVVGLGSDTQYYARVRYHGSTLVSDWSAMSAFTTSAIVEGAVLSDGGIVGPQFGGYFLIVAPATQRGQAIRHGLYGTDTALANIADPSTPDASNGKTNTDILTNAPYNTINDGEGSIGAPAAEFCRAISADWFLPTRDELGAILAIAATIDAADTSGGTLTFGAMVNSWIWSSTERLPETTWAIRADGSATSYSHRAGQYCVVPARRIAV
ncbi:MAG: hypothetical protein JRG71_15780, partial [Deltaproteobacteria bacterium]|nr:hypothetical protein [Deltaproteobacteria bacterium]